MHLARDGGFCIRSLLNCLSIRLSFLLRSALLFLLVTFEGPGVVLA